MASSGMGVTQTLKRVLIVRTDRIGDVILTLPAIEALKCVHPDWHIGVLVHETTAPLLEGVEGIDECVVDQRSGRHRGLVGWMRLVRQLKQGRWDAAVNYHTKRRTNALLWAAAIDRRLGYKNEKWGWLLTEPFEDIRVVSQKHERDLCVHLLKQAGWLPEGCRINNPRLKPNAFVLKETAVVLNRLCRGRPLFAVHPAASGPEKQWSLDHFVCVMETLSAKYDPVWLILAAAKDKPLTATLSAKVRQSGLEVHDWGGATDLRRLIALLSLCRLLISNDSGPVHVAAAVDTPVVSIFTRNQPGIGPARWAPLGRWSRAIAPFPEGDVASHPPNENTILVPHVDPESVVACVDEVLKLCYD